MKNTALRNALVTLGSFIFVVTVVSAWTAPTGTPPTNNVSAPITISVSDQEKFGGLTLASMHSLGAIQIGNSISACSALLSGAIRWTGTAMEYCNGVGPEWTVFGSGGGGGSCPIVGGSYQLSVNSNVSVYNVFTQAQLCGGINLLIPQSFTVTIATGIDVGNFVVGNIVSGSSVKIVNRGRIFGAGGAGGAAGPTSQSCCDVDGYPTGYTISAGSPGSAGGHAITLKTGIAASIDNYGFIYGGGGGGGGSYSVGPTNGGGGGGAGYPAGPGGPGVGAGSTGTLFVGGGGGSGAGSGGNTALSGVSGAGSYGGAGGAPGNAVKLNGATITWISGNDATHVIGAVN